MSPGTFERRMRALVAQRYPVLALSDAIARMGDGTLPDGAVVITFDDGFRSTFEVALPLLQELALPATVYVTSYYVTNRAPIFRLAIAYMFWKTDRRRVALDGLSLGLKGEWPLANPNERDLAASRIIELGEQIRDESSRQQVCAEFAERLGLDYGRIAARGAFTLASPAQVEAAAANRVDIQLHTHRHRFPPNDAICDDELVRNRAVLEPLAKRPLTHFCYPSGIWSPAVFPPLRRQGVSTAVTCDLGLNDRRTEPLALKRYLDDEDIPQVVFDAELAGFAELARRARRHLEARRFMKPRFSALQRFG